MAASLPLAVTDFSTKQLCVHQSPRRDAPLAREVLQFNTRTTLRVFSFLFWKSRSRIVFRKVWSLLCGCFKTSSKEDKNSLLHISASKLKLGLTLFGGRTNQSSPSTPGFPLQTPDLYEVAPSSTLLPILCLPPTLEVFRVAPIHSLLPIHCLPPSLTSTRVLIGRVSSDQVSLVLILV